jgi:protein ImuB
VPEVIEICRAPVEFAAARDFDFPVADRGAVAHHIGRLVRQVCRDLVHHGCGGLAWEVRLRRGADSPVRWTIELFRPAQSAAHVNELAQMHLEQCGELGLVDGVSVAVTRSVRIAERQQLLAADWIATPDTQPGDDLALGRLVDRFVGRLGAHSVLGARIVDDHEPARAGACPPLVGMTAHRKVDSRAPRTPTGAKPRRHWQPLDRPLSLLQPPARLRCVSVAPAGPPHLVWHCGRRQRVVRQWGPERIETGWWRGPSVRRDYWRLETDGGSWLWVYRDLVDGEWYLEGLFD